MPDWSEQFLRVVLPIIAGLVTLAVVMGGRLRGTFGFLFAKRRRVGAVDSGIAQDTVTELVRQIETRLDRLESLIATADERLAWLHEAEQRVAQLNLTRLEPPAIHTADAAKIEQNGVPPKTPRKRARKRTLSTVPNQTAPLGEMSERHAQVLALAGEGRSADQISESLSMPLGEIELILRLNALAV